MGFLPMLQTKTEMVQDEQAVICGSFGSQNTLQTSIGTLLMSAQQYRGVSNTLKPTADVLKGALMQTTDDVKAVHDDNPMHAFSEGGQHGWVLGFGKSDSGESWDRHGNYAA